jgi:hypothetical protein
MPPRFTTSIPFLNEYVKCFGASPAKNDSSKLQFQSWDYYDPIDFGPSEEIYSKAAALSGANDEIDSVLEYALASYYSKAIINIRPIKAAEMLPENSKVSALRLGMAVLKELTELKFLDPSNTAAIGRYEGMIKFISDKNGVTRAEMQDYLKQGIAEVVREKFSEIHFRLENGSNSYTAALSYDLHTRIYTLSYGGYYTNDIIKVISGNSLDGLLAAMKNSPDFDARGSAFRLVQEKAGNIPAVVYSSWVEKRMTTVDAVQLAADTIANFYISPTNANYDLLVGVFGLFDRSRGVEDPVADAGRDAYSAVIADLNEQLGRKASIDGLNKGTVLAKNAQAYNPDYSIFTVRSDIGGF